LNDSQLLNGNAKNHTVRLYYNETDTEESNSLKHLPGKLEKTGKATKPIQTGKAASMKGH